jgi:hypothetical protein
MALKSLKPPPASFSCSFAESLEGLFREAVPRVEGRPEIGLKPRTGKEELETRHTKYESRSEVRSKGCRIRLHGVDVH